MCGTNYCNSAFASQKYERHFIGDYQPAGRIIGTTAGTTDYRVKRGRMRQSARTLQLDLPLAGQNRNRQRSSAADQDHTGGLSAPRSTDTRRTPLRTP